MNELKSYPVDLVINNHKIKKALISPHYKLKHSHYMNDELILRLVKLLDGGVFPVDSTSKGIEYYVADIEYGVKIYRLIWLFEGSLLEILGIINAYRRRSKNEKK